MRSVDAETLYHWLQRGDAVLVDVRELVEYREGRIPGAQLLPSTEVCIAALPRHDGKPIILYCHEGSRATAACERLRKEAPNLNVYHLAGGIESWRAAGLSLEESALEAPPIAMPYFLRAAAAALTGRI